jgi:hypothetical protein
MTTKAQLSERAEAIESLRAEFKPGDKVRTILRHCSASGMSRSISPINLSVDDKGRVSAWDCSYPVSLALGYSMDRNHYGVRVQGCGMDMGFHLVYSLSRALYPDGFECIGNQCPSNDHSNGDRDYTPGHVVHHDGGYALRHDWL